MIKRVILLLLFPFFSWWSEEGGQQNCCLGLPEVKLWLVQETDTVPCDAVLKGRGVQEGWTLFKREILKALEQALPMC